MSARVRDRSPVTAPTTWYQSFPGATAISRSQSFAGTTKPVLTYTVNGWPTFGVESPTATVITPLASAAGAAIAAAQQTSTASLTLGLRDRHGRRSISVG